MPTFPAGQDSSRRTGARRPARGSQHRRRRLFVEPLEYRCLLNGQSLLFAGIDDAAVSPTNAGLILAAELDAGRQLPLHAQLPFTGEGISGLAFKSSGVLFGATSAGPGSTSKLVRVDPLTGEIASSLPITVAGTPISIGDLAVQPGTDTIYGVRSADDGGGGAGALYTIDASGAATFVGQLATEGSLDVGLAFADADTLYYTTAMSGAPVLFTLDAGTLAQLDMVALIGSKGFTTGLGYRADDGTLVGSGAANGDIVSIDPATGVRTVIPLDAPARGIMGDLAFQPDSPIVELVHHADFEGSNNGYTADNTGGTFPGLWHYSLGRRNDGLLDHSPTHAWYYGAFEGPRGEGRYNVFPGDHQGILISPLVQLPEQGTSILSFSYVLDTRLPFDVDFVDVLIDNGGGEPTVIKSRQDGTLLQTGREKWLTATADISAFNGQEIRVLFRFNTGDVPRIDPEGWYVDDVQISNLLQLGSITWEKRDATSNDLLGGATFTVTPNPLSGSGSLEVLDNGPFDADPDPGQILVENVLWGAYTVTETIAPTGYGTDPTPTRQVEVGPTDLNPVIETDFLNPRLTGSIAWEKRDATNNDLSGGATFAVTPNPLSGNGSLEVLDNGPFDADPDPGQILVENVLWGTYTVTETIAPTGYDTDPVPTRQVEVSATDLNPVIEVDFLNPRLPGSIQWEKRDATSNDLLGGATFTVTPNPLAGSGSLEVLDNGPFDADPDQGQILIENVLWGVYTVTETIAPTGYATDPTPTRQVEVSAIDLNPVIETDFLNPRLPGSIQWKKRDATSNDLLGGATFTVTPSPLSGSGSLEVLDNGPFDADPDPGQILIENVLWGVYTVTETIAPTGYATDPTPTRQVEVSATDLNPVIELDFLNPRLPASIGGRVWIDVNGNTIIDENLAGGGNGEAGIPNVMIRLLAADMTLLDTRITSGTVMDVDGDGTDDPIGSYFFGDLADGNYLVDVMDATVPKGFGLTTGFDPLGVSLAPTQQRRADFGYQNSIQFATALGFFRPDVPEEFAFVPFVRPADQPLLNLLEDPNRDLGDYLDFLTSAATNPQSYQVFEIENTTSALLTVTGFEIFVASPGSAEFVRIYTQQQLQELTDLEAQLGDPLTDEQIAQLEALLKGVTDASDIDPIPGGESITLFAFYQPVIRNPDGTVDTQFPEWYDDPQKNGNQTLQVQGAAHTFARDDHVEFTTALDGIGAGPTFQYQLVGGSTYDSDVGNYDGLATLLDFGVLDDVLLQSSPTTPGQPSWDPTTDVNVRFPNGAKALAGLFWPLTVPKEIGMGDFGPLNVEIVRGSRAPFLDLDADNDSLAKGVDYATRYSGLPVNIADADARFGNDPLINLAGLDVIILQPLDGANEQLAVDTSGTTIVVDSNEFQGGRWVLSLSGTATIETYLSVLATITYTNNRETPTPGVRVIEVSALGSSDFVYEQAGLTIDQRVGNVALARVVVEPEAVVNPLAAAAAMPASDEPQFDAAAVPAGDSQSAQEFKTTVNAAVNAGEQQADDLPQASAAADTPSPAIPASPLTARPAPVADSADTSEMADETSGSSFQTETLARNNESAAPAAREADTNVGHAEAINDDGATDEWPNASAGDSITPQVTSGEVVAAWWTWSDLHAAAGESTSTAEGSSPTNAGTDSIDDGMTSEAPSRQLAAVRMPGSRKDGDNLTELDAVFAEFGSDDETAFFRP